MDQLRFLSRKMYTLWFTLKRCHALHKFSYSRIFYWNFEIRYIYVFTFDGFLYLHMYIMINYISCKPFSCSFFIGYELFNFKAFLTFKIRRKHQMFQYLFNNSATLFNHWQYFQPWRKAYITIMYILFCMYLQKCKF